MARKVAVTETTLRDGQQSMWATRMTTAMMMPMLPVLDRAGHDAIECMGTAIMDSCVRYLKEDPWERLRLLKAGMPRTPLQLISSCLGVGGGTADIADRGVVLRPRQHHPPPGRAFRHADAVGSWRTGRPHRAARCRRNRRDGSSG